MTPPKDSLSLEKLKIHDRLLSVEKYVSDGIITREHINKTLEEINITLKILNIQVNGENGINIRIKDLETEEKNRKEVKNGFIKVAVGSMTMAIGAAVLWVCKLIWLSLGK